VQRLRRLTGRRRARQAEDRFVVEGAKLVGEAQAAGAVIETVFLDAAAATAAERQLAQACAASGAQLLELQPGVLDRVCETVTSQPIAAIVGTIDITMTQLRDRGPDLVVICADVRDPGNVGTIIRGAGAAGASAVICCDGSVDVYNPKVVRSSAGMLFHLPVIAGGDAAEVLDEVGGWGLRRWGTYVRDGCDYAQVDLAAPIALVLGNEAHGLSVSLRPHLDGTLSIPMAGPAESINVATAAAVVCFEAARQRRAQGRVAP
jgi:RNA methyltransferase, TrmH family